MWVKLWTWEIYFNSIIFVYIWRIEKDIYMNLYIYEDLWRIEKEPYGLQYVPFNVMLLLKKDKIRHKRWNINTHDRMCFSELCFFVCMYLNLKSQKLYRKCPETSSNTLLHVCLKRRFLDISWKHELGYF